MIWRIACKMAVKVKLANVVIGEFSGEGLQ